MQKFEYGKSYTIFMPLVPTSETYQDLILSKLYSLGLDVEIIFVPGLTNIQIVEYEA